VKLLFTSSVSATNMWDIARGPVPEQVIQDPSVATSSGYGASKFITENVSVVRIGGGILN
jgi:hypothetical protein